MTSNTVQSAGEELGERVVREQARFQLDRAPLWSAILFNMPEGQRLLLTAHHLIIDGVSWRILLDDLERVLDDQAASRLATLPARSAHGELGRASAQRRRDEPRSGSRILARTAEDERAS